MIEPIHSFHEIKLDKLANNALFIFDVDETLITPADLLLKPVGNSFTGWSKIKQEEFEHFLSIMFASVNYVLVDEYIPELMNHLHQNGISTIGLTACSTGPFGIIPSMANWRCDQLSALGIYFNCTDEFVFSEQGLFKNGILFTGNLQSTEKSYKGVLLEAFLKRIGWVPEQIVFVDDNRMHLEAVQGVLKEKGISFQGYLIQRPSPTFNEEIAELQIQTLIDSGLWISDQQARDLGTRKL